MLFEAGDGGHAYETISMEPSEEGTWKTKVETDLMGKFYTFNVKINDKWLGDTPVSYTHLDVYKRQIP